VTAQVWIAILVGMAAMIDDLRRRHIANWIPAVALVGGFGWQIARGGWSGALTALLGAVAGFAVFLVFYWLGGMGGGDIKLMAGFGALLGTESLLEAALWTAGVGGILALGTLGCRSLWKRLPGQVAIAASLSPQEQQAAAERAESIPYAPAIALGVWIALIPKV
jgi:prepilin peptidase CpaA